MNFQNENTPHPISAFLRITESHQAITRRCPGVSLGIARSIFEGIQSLYSEPKIVMKVSGRIGDPATIQSGVKQGCALSPTLFSS